MEDLMQSINYNNSEATSKMSDTSSYPATSDNYKYKQHEKENAQMNYYALPHSASQSVSVGSDISHHDVSGACTRRMSTLNFDCEGEFRIATIGNQKESNKFQKFFSPLRVPDHMRVLRKTSTNKKHTGDDGTFAEIEKGAKRSRDDDICTHDEILGSINALKKKRKKQEAAEVLIANVLYMRVESEKVYDRCPAVAEKIKEFLAREGVKRSSFLNAISVHGNSLNAFLNGKDQEQCCNKSYKPSYIFFEKLRILEGRPKSRARLLNEQNFPDGFATKKSRDTKKKVVSIDCLPVSSSEFC